MKITDVRSHPLQTPLAQPFAFSQGWVNKRSATLVEIVTDTGITGWGEAFNQGLEPPQISAAAIEYALKPLILGADPLATEVLWRHMYHQTRDYGRKGSVIAAISAVDIALWDIAGKHYGVPIAKLLGGFFRNKVAAYATGFYRISGQGEASRLGEEAIAHYEAGFRAMKVKLGYGLDDDLAVMREIKRALGAREVTLMQVNPHVWGSGVAQAASLQLIAALPVTHHAVFPTQPILEYDTSSHPFRRDLISPAVVQRDGSVDIPLGPGLGIEINREVLERYRA